MKLLLAPDAFKGSLSAAEAAEAMAAGIRSVMPEAEVISMPLADGGEETLDVLHASCGGDVRNDILYFEDNGAPCSLIESARLIGPNVPDMQCDVFERGSKRVGAALLSALDAGVQDIRIALGGSATVDGGLGLLTRLGCCVTDHAGAPVSADLHGMMQAVRVDQRDLDPRLNNVQITLLSDVQNPLCGSRGAVHVYGSQKGIQDNRLSEVESAMQRWASLCEQAFGISSMHDAGAGAAGGLGFALKLLGAEVVSGAAYVMHACGFEQAVATADWLVTGEGRSDAQTWCGKLPMVVARTARDCGVKTALISGAVAERQGMQQFFDAVIAATPADYPPSNIATDAGMLLHRAAAAWATTIRRG